MSDRADDASNVASSSTPPGAGAAIPEEGLPGFRVLDERTLASAQAVGVDSGATLVKICVEDPRTGIHLATWPAPSIDRVLALLERLEPSRVGVTGCGTRGITSRLGREAAAPLEFDAWGRGANRLLEEMGRPASEPYLLVSIGTGTSALRVEGDRVERVGGSSLGGGTALGLGLALTGCRSHRDLAHLAARGKRGGVDLLISDIYGEAEIPLAGEATAASFGKLARALHQAPEAKDVAREDEVGDHSGDGSSSGEASPPAFESAATPSPAPEDLAAAIMGLVAENIALICNAHAQSVGVSTIVYGGSTLSENPSLIQTVQVLTRVLGREALVLPESGHAGALGAMLLGR
jgi:type II pantothenate kinase